MPISIIMPAYNGEKYLPQAIDSVLSQSHQDWELIISDDGSKDGTRDILSDLQKRNDPRIKIHFQPKNLNIFGNLNFLFSQVKTEITQILCQDDYFIDDGALDKILEQWRELPAEIAYLRMNHSVETKAGLAGIEGSVLPSIIRSEESDLLFFIFGCIPGNLSNVSVRTAVARDAGWFRTDLPYAGDFEFWSRLGHSHLWAISKVRAVQIRSHSGQASKIMNPRGELLPQMSFILNSLYSGLVASGYSPGLLRLLATLNYTSQHRYNGIKAIIKGHGSTYLRSVAATFDASDFSFGPLLGWSIFFASLGGRIFKIPVAKMLLKNVPPAQPAKELTPAS